MQTSDTIYLVLNFLILILLILTLAKRRKDSRDNPDNKVKNRTDKFIRAMTIFLAAHTFSLVFMWPWSHANSSHSPHIPVEGRDGCSR